MSGGAPEPRGVLYLVGLVIVLGVELENFGLLSIEKILHDIIHLKILPPGLGFGVHLLGQDDVEFPGSEKSELNRTLSVVDVEGKTRKKVTNQVDGIQPLSVPFILQLFPHLRYQGILLGRCVARVTRASRGVGNWIGVVIVLGVERGFADFSHLEGVGNLSYLSLQFNQGQFWKRTDISGV